MPPSGYNQEQAQAIADFLRSCARALKAEAEERGEALADAADREVRDIAQARRTQSFEPLPATLLDLTAAFYRDFQKALSETGGDFEAALESACSLVVASILGISV